MVSRYDNVDVQVSSKDAGIVLGAALWDGELSPALEERCQKALDLYRRGLVKYLILTGGLGDDQISEAEAMKRFFIKQGIPDNRLLVEDQATNTQQNFQYSQKWIRQKHITDVYVITHDFHLYRALHYAKQLHIKATPAPVHSQVMWMPYHKTRESLALIKQRILHQ